MRRASPARVSLKTDRPVMRRYIFKKEKERERRGRGRETSIQEDSLNVEALHRE